MNPVAGIRQGEPVYRTMLRENAIGDELGCDQSTGLVRGLG